MRLPAEHNGRVIERQLLTLEVRSARIRNAAVDYDDHSCLTFDFILGQDVYHDTDRIDNLTHRL